MSPGLDWDTIDAAVASMRNSDLEDVRASASGPHTAEISFAHPEPRAFFADEYAFGSVAEVNTANMVIGYTFRFPAITPLPGSPEGDSIKVALTAAADPLPPGRTIDVVGRQMDIPNTALAPHIRGRETEPIDLAEFATIAPEVQSEFYDRL